MSMPDPKDTLIVSLRAQIVALRGDLALIHRLWGRVTLAPTSPSLARTEDDYADLTVIETTELSLRITLARTQLALANLRVAASALYSVRDSTPDALASLWDDLAAAIIPPPDERPLSKADPGVVVLAEVASLRSLRDTVEAFLTKVHGVPSSTAGVWFALDQIAARCAEHARYLTAFTHTHVPVQAYLTDTCAQCGLDLRDPIHRRVQP